MSEKLTREIAMKVIEKEMQYYWIDVELIDHDCKIAGENEKGETLVKYPISEQIFDEFPDRDLSFRHILATLDLLCSKKCLIVSS